MQPVFFFVIVSALLAAAIAAIVILSLRLVKLLHAQSDQIQELTKLAASKDLAAFTAMQATEIQAPSFDEQLLDDRTVAKMLSEKYKEHGLDPNLAYSVDDDPINDFGGPQAFLG